MRVRLIEKIQIKPKEWIHQTSHLKKKKKKQTNEEKYRKKNICQWASRLNPKKKANTSIWPKKKKDLNTSRIHMGITSRFDRINVRCASILLGQTRTAKWIRRNLKDLHKPSLYGFALVDDSLASYFQATNKSWINPIFLEKGSDNCQAEPNFMSKIKIKIKNFNRINGQTALKLDIKIGIF